MKPEVRERRLEMLNLYGKGLDEKHIITDTAKKWGVKRGTVYQDWYRRGRWIKDVTGFRDVEKAFWEMMFDLKQLANRAYILHLKTEHPTAQVGALRLVANIKFKMAEMLWGIRREEDLEELRERLDAIEEAFNLDERIKQLEEIMDEHQGTTEEGM